MSIKIKQQKLIDPTKANKKKRGSAQNKQTTQKKVPPKVNVATQSTTKKGLSKSTIVVISLFALLAIAIPKPSLITYQKLGIVTNSIYWPGFLIFESQLLDSNLTVSGNIENNSLYICDQLNNKASCQKYKIIEQQGFFASIAHYFSH